MPSNEDLKQALIEIATVMNYIFSFFLGWIAVEVAIEKLKKDVIRVLRGEEAVREYEERQRRMLEERRAIVIEITPKLKPRIYRLGEEKHEANRETEKTSTT